jgi:hypothetical protein
LSTYIWQICQYPTMSDAWNLEKDILRLQNDIEVMEQKLVNLGSVEGKQEALRIFATDHKEQ